MTDAEIDALPAGRELDALVAEKILGLHVLRERFRQVGDGLIVLTDEQWQAGWQDMTSMGRALRGYSTEIGAAWQIVEHFDNRVSIYGPHAEYAYGEYANHTGWVCEISGQGHYVNARAETAPLAICLAALKSIGAG